MIKIIIQLNTISNAETEQTTLTLPLATESQISLTLYAGRVGGS